LRARPPLSVLLGNLSYRITDEDLAGFFKDCGEIQAVRWLTHQDTGNFKGQGYAEFCESSAADAAIELNGQLLCGRPVKLDWDAGGRGGRYSGGGGGGGGGSWEDH
jgi:RNA recognition motif-containing protein